MAEHLGFDLSFLLAGGSTVALFSANTEWVFRDRTLAWRSLAVFLGVYAFIYVLLRIEAYALLVGALVSFAAIAAAMFLTRSVDWYQDDVPPHAAAQGMPGPTIHDSWLR